MFDFIPIAPVTAVLIASLLVILTGCFRSVDAAYKTINWESVVLIGAMMPMSTALEKTGVSQIVSETLVNSFRCFLGLMHYWQAFISPLRCSRCLSATPQPPCLWLPLLWFACSASGLLVPMHSFFAVTLGASMCFASPFSTPPNALVMKAGNYTFMDYVRVGLPLQLIIGIAMTFVLPLLFPF